MSTATPMHEELVTFRVHSQWLAVPVAAVQEVMSAQRLALVPLAPSEIAGFLNLRGQIVVALDVRTRLSLPQHDAAAPEMIVVVRHDDELTALVVDEVGEVHRVDPARLEQTPATIGADWRAVCRCIIRREGDLLLVVDIPALLQLERAPR